MKKLTFILILLALCATMVSAETTTKTFGKAPTLTTPVAISTLNAEPQKYADSTVLVTGKIIGMCPHSGCWIAVLAPDSSKIICKSMDESVHFTKECMNQTVRVQGNLVFDTKAPGEVQKKHEGEEKGHACPAPKVMVSLLGAQVDLAAAAPEAKTEPKTETK